MNQHELDRENQVNDANRRTVFDALCALGIEEVEIDFDGSEGKRRLEEVLVTGGSEALTGTVAFRRSHLTGEAVSLPLADVVELLCYALLEQHDGVDWCDDIGAYGTFYFIADERMVRLVFHRRIADTETSFHDFIDETEAL